MPPNRRSIPREERLEAVIGAARKRFEANGYKATSIADIAGDLGVNTGSIHWYFPSKDELFAAVVTRIVAESKASVDAALESGVAPMDALVGFLTTAERYRGIHVDAHERIANSDAVAEAHESLHHWLDDLLLTAVRPQLAAGQDVSLIADTAHIVFEGLLGSTIPRDRPFDEIVRFLIDILASAAPHAAPRKPAKPKRVAR